MSDRIKAESCSRYLKGLADPERLKIVECLQAQPRTVSELTAMLRSELANVSHHLSVLRRANLVRTRRKGKNIFYSLNPKVLTGKGTALNFGCCKIVLPAAKKRSANAQKTV